MGRRTYYFVAPLIPPALSSTQFFRPTHRITISKYLARGLRVRRSGVLPLCLGPNSVAERIIPPSEILGRQFVPDSLYSLSFFKVTRVTYYSPTSSFYQLLGCSSRFKNTPANIWPEATGVRRSGGLAPSASGQILSLSGIFAASALTQCRRCYFGFLYLFAFIF